MSEGQCSACDLFGRVNDWGLCADCVSRLDRDLIRQRDWDYSASTFLLSDDDREKLRSQIIREYGETLELIAPLKESLCNISVRSSHRNPGHTRIR